MTNYRSIVITDKSVQVFTHDDNVESAEQFEYDLRASHPDVRTYHQGDINGEQYTVIYCIEKKKARS